MPHDMMTKTSRKIPGAPRRTWKSYKPASVKLPRSFSMPRAVACNMRIERVDAALEGCVKYLSATDVTDKEIENLLTQSLLILICAEFEKKFRELIRDRCSSVNDRSINEYVESHIRRSPRGLRPSDIADTLAQFGRAHKDKFDRRRHENRQAESMYSSIVVNRNSVAHAADSRATLEEVKGYYEGGHVLLDYFKDALWLEDDAA